MGDSALILSLLAFCSILLWFENTQNQVSDHFQQQAAVFRGRAVVMGIIMWSWFWGKTVWDSRENKSSLLPPGSFLLANSRLSPHSSYVSRLFGPTLPGNMTYCLRFYFSLRGEWHPALQTHRHLPRHLFLSAVVLFESMYLLWFFWLSDQK